jgi:AraC family transcriptional regulator
MTLSPHLTFHTAIYRGGERHAPHWHEELQLSLVMSGMVLESTRFAESHGSALSVAVKDAGVVHADEFGPGETRMVRLELPAGTLAALLDDPDRNPVWRWRHDPAVARPFLALVGDALSGAGSFPADDPRVLDLLAALTARPATRSGSTPRWLEQIVAHLRAEWQPRLTVAAVARQAGVHPVYLARCFRRWYGIGVAEELRRLRLRRAAALLIDEPDSVAAAAYDAGFADEPHFCRTFGQAAGLSPGRYRQLLRQLGFSAVAAPRGS